MTQSHAPHRNPPSTDSNGSQDQYEFETAANGTSDGFDSTQETPSPQHRPRASRRDSSNTLKRLMLGMCLVGLLVAGAFAFPTVRERIFGKAAENKDLILETVKRGRFRVSVTERGTLGSLKNATLHSRVEGSTTILSIVPEGSQVSKPVPALVTGIITQIQASGENQIVTVKGDSFLINVPFLTALLPSVTVEHVVPMGQLTKLLFEENTRVEAGEFIAGDIVCELDSSALVEKEKTQQISVTKAEADLENGRSNIEIQLNMNLSDMAAAQLKLDLDRLDLKTFEQGERIQKENIAKGAVLLAQEDLTQRQETYQYFRGAAKKGYKTQVELETARQAVVKAQNTLAVALDELKVLRNFKFERTFKELKANSEESVREMKRVDLKGIAALNGFRAVLKSRRLTYSVEVEKLRRLRDQIDACTLIAPQDGKVVYANQRSRRSEAVVIEEGTAVRERQAIITLPDFSQMKVEAKVHESKVSNVAEGLPVLIKVDAIPDKTFRGVVHILPDVPVKGEWPNTDMMLYETIVKITDAVEGLKPGMNTEIEIIAEDRDDVLQVPVQAIIAVGDKFIAFVMTDNGVELREDLKIGSSNSKMIEIKSGLEEDEQVVMNPNSHYANRIEAMRSKIKEKMLKVKSTSVSRKTAPGAKKKGRKKSAGGRGGFDPMAYFKKADKNGDGKITKDEASDRMRPNFAKIDTNGDDGIDLAEFQAMMKQASGGGGGRR